MDLLSFKEKLPEYKAVLGIDYGSKRIGLAVSDLLRNIASAYKILYRDKWQEDVAQLKQIIKEKEIGGIIYGLPLQMDGTEGNIAKEVQEFASKLAKEIPLPYAFWDERLSSCAAENFLIKEVDLSRRKRQKVLDAAAAAYILQGALDAMQYRKDM